MAWLAAAGWYGGPRKTQNGEAPFFGELGLCCCLVLGKVDLQKLMVKWVFRMVIMIDVKA